MRPRTNEAAQRPWLMVPVAIVTLPVAVSGCLSPTDITLEITSDLPCSKIDGLTITAGPHGTVERDKVPSAVAGTCSKRDGGASFGTLVLTPGGSPDAEITVRVVAGVSPIEPMSCTEENDYAGCVVVRRVLRYEEHSELTLPIELRDSCSEVRCIGEDATCVDGVCLPSKIDDPSRCVGDGCAEAKLFAGVKSPGCLGDQDFAAPGTIPGVPHSFLGALSSDGRVVFGFSSFLDSDGGANFANGRAFRCASFHERTPVPGPHDRPFVPQACDTAGTSMVGYDSTGDGGFAPVRWSAGEAVEIPAFDGSSGAYGCDRESCTKLVGQSVVDPVFWRSPSHRPSILRGADGESGGFAVGIDPSGRFAFGQLVDLAVFWDVTTNKSHVVSEDTENAIVNQVTPDGAVLVGSSTQGHSIVQHAFIWKAVERWASYQAQELAPVPAPDKFCSALAISDDGALVTGFCGSTGASVAALWEASSGFAPVVLADRVAVPPGWKLLAAEISADGTIVAGTALDTKHKRQVFVARLK